MISFLYFGKARLEKTYPLCLTSWDLFISSCYVFKRGSKWSWKQEFNYGVEFVLLISFVDDAIGAIEDALTSLQGLAMGFPSLIVQSTQGQNFNLATKEYTHAVVTRFRSREPSFPLTIYLCSDSVPPSFCLPLLTGFFFFCSRGSWDIWGQLGLQTCKEQNILISAYLGFDIHFNELS